MSTNQARKIYNTSRWRYGTRLERLELDDYKCRQCGRPTRSVHHDPPLEILISQGGDPYDVEHTVSLCRRCHGQADGGRAHPPKPPHTNRFRPWL